MCVITVILSQTLLPTEMYSRATLYGQSARTSDGDGCPEDNCEECDDKSPHDATSGKEQSGK